MKKPAYARKRLNIQTYEFIWRDNLLIYLKWCITHSS